MNSTRSVPVIRKRTGSSRMFWVMILVVLLVVGSFPLLDLLPAPAVSEAAAVPTPLPAGVPCVDSQPTGASYVARVCITAPADGATLTADPSTLTATVTAASGTMPAVDHVLFYLQRANIGTHPSLMSDYASPWMVQIPTTHYKDGGYRLDAKVVFANNDETPDYATIYVTFQTGTTADQHSDGSWTPKTSDASPLTIAAVGDGAGGLPGSYAVGNLVAGMNPDLFLYLGDIYNAGTYAEFTNYYDTAFGQLKGITNPVPGNHEARGNGYTGYMDYWNASTTSSSGIRHYYSFDSGGWHFIALDANFESDTAAGQEQYNWLSQQLDAIPPDSCTIAFFHQPRWGTGVSATPYMQDIWSLLSLRGVDVVLNGHEHDYQRFYPMDANGNVVTTGGMVEYIVGTGGHELMTYRNDPRVASYFSTDGALKLNLTSTGGTSQFIDTSGTVLDQSSFTCNGSSPATPTPPTPDPNVPLTLEPVADAMVAQAAPDANYGTTTMLHADLSPNEESYLKFDVQGISQSVTSAKLRLWLRDGTANAPQVVVCSDTSWQERGITWNNKPAAGAVVADLGAVNTGTWIEYDVTSAITGNGLVTFGLIAQSSDALSANSRENSSERPQLVITQQGTGPVVTPTLGPTAPPTTSTNFLPAADARVEEANPLLNYGTSTLLRSDGGTGESVETYIRFNVTNMTATPTSVKLRLLVQSTTNAGSVNGPELYLADNTDWSETGISWAGKPSRSTTPIGDLGPVAGGTWVEYDVSSVVTGNGTYTFVLASTSTDATDFFSRETADAPQLVLTTPSSGGPTITPTVTPTLTPTATATATVTPTIIPTVPSGTGGTVGFEPVADAMVAQAAPDAHYGTTTVLHGDLSPFEMSYLKFDVQGISQPVTSAKLRLYVRDAGGTVDAPGVALSSDTSWTEAGITWNTRPATGSVVSDLANAANASWIEYDVTAQVTGNGLITFALIPQNNDGISLNSRENATNRPQLVLTVGAGGGPTITPAVTPSIAPTLTPTLTPSVGAVTPTVPGGSQQSGTFEPVADAMVAQAAPDANYGNTTVLHADLSPQEMSYLKFDVEGMSQPITSAKLRLFTTANGGSANAPGVALSADTGWTETGITWNNKPATGSVVSDAGQAPNAAWVEYDVTGQVTGNGLITFALIPQSTDGISYNSRQGSANHPQLVITTGGAGGASPITPTVTPTNTPTPVVTPSAGVTPSVTPTVIADSPGALIFDAAADAMVAEANPNGNYGSTTSFHADLSPMESAYLTFDVEGVSGPIASATLRLWVRSGTADAPGIAVSSDTGWTESGITWATRPAVGPVIADLGDARAADVWIEYDVTSAVTGNGPVSFALVPQTSDGISFNSRENASGSPQLVVVTSGAGGASAAQSLAVPALVATGTPAMTTTPTATATATQEAALGEPADVMSTATAQAPVEGPVSIGTVVNTGTQGVYCRATPASDGTVLGVLHDGDQVRVTGAQDGDYLPVRCLGMDGYVAAAYLTLSPLSGGPVPTVLPTMPVAPTATVEVVVPTTVPTDSPTATSATSGVVTGTDGDGVQCHSGPSIDDPVLGVLPEGSSVTILGPAADGWWPVDCGDGQTGYVVTTYVTVDGGSAPAPGSDSEATEVSTAPTPATGGEGTGPAATATPYPVLSAIDTEESDTARLVIDGDPATVWQVHPDQSPDQVRLRLDLGDVVPIDRITWDVSDPTVLPPFEVWLSTDDVTWWNAAQVDTSTVQAGQTYATPLGYRARYVKLVISDVEQTGLSEVGGLGELAVWPATDARDLTELGSPVTPDPVTTAPAAVDSSDMLPTPEPAPTDEPIATAPEIVPTEAPTEQIDEAPAVPTPGPGDESNGG